MRTISVAFLMVFVVIGLGFGQTKPQPAREKRNDTAIFLDNIAYHDDGDEFASAFASEKTCSGLSLMLWTNHTDEERLQGMKARWWMHYAHIVPQAALTSINRYPDDSDVAGPSIVKDGGSRTAKEAVRWACFIVKHKGGTVDERIEGPRA
jgi:hypothetical protein